MRSKTPLIVMRFADDASITYLTNGNKWKAVQTPLAATYGLKSWLNSGNAWNAIAKLVKTKKYPFSELFVSQGLELTPFTENDSISFAMIQSLTTDQGELDAIAHEALKEKSEQIELLEETLTELRVAMIHGSED